MSEIIVNNREHCKYLCDERKRKRSMFQQRMNILQEIELWLIIFRSVYNNCKILNDRFFTLFHFDISEGVYLPSSRKSTQVTNKITMSSLYLLKEDTRIKILFLSCFKCSSLRPVVHRNAQSGKLSSTGKNIDFGSFAEIFLYLS